MSIWPQAEERSIQKPGRSFSGFIQKPVQKPPFRNQEGKLRNQVAHSAGSFRNQVAHSAASFRNRHSETRKVNSETRSLIQRFHSETRSPIQRVHSENKSPSRFGEFGGFLEMETGWFGTVGMVRYGRDGTARWDWETGQDKLFSFRKEFGMIYGRYGTVQYGTVGMVRWGWHGL